jgi:hypothetical protein
MEERAKRIMKDAEDKMRMAEVRRTPNTIDSRLRPTLKRDALELR